MKILIAEDNHYLQNLLHFVMNQWGYDYDLVHNGLEALSTAQTTTYDLCLMDLQMPLLDGYQATRRLRKLVPYFPIVAFTATGTLEYNSLIDDCLQKPFELTLLKRTIEQLTVKRSTLILNKHNDINLKKETPMDSEHLRELRALDQKGLTKLVIRNTGNEVIVAKNVQNKITHDLIAKGQELAVFLDRSDKPGVCHLYKSTLHMTTGYLLPESMEALIEEEDLALASMHQPALNREQD
ncbi:uncharacterized protein LOC132558377 [Ylistrum balloti]|uniref:uncharacterized protein LOC132558377 n=1 Tax=Ylistrum balloti TaxID=509963 RepID=UPI002905A7F6|nr:uncharacterized protein LOC132558377 [Ylistrum balloti]